MDDEAGPGRRHQNHHENDQIIVNIYVSSRFLVFEASGFSRFLFFEASGFSRFLFFEASGFLRFLFLRQLGFRGFFFSIPFFDPCFL